MTKIRLKRLLLHMYTRVENLKIKNIVKKKHTLRPEGYSKKFQT